MQIFLYRVFGFHLSFRFTLLLLPIGLILLGSNAYADEKDIIRAFNNFYQSDLVTIGTLDSCKDSTIKLCDSCQPMPGVILEVSHRCLWKAFAGNPKQIYVISSKDSAINCQGLSSYMKTDKPILFYGRGALAPDNSNKRIIYSQSNLIVPLSIPLDSLQLRDEYAISDKELANGKKRETKHRMPPCYRGDLKLQ